MLSATPEPQLSHERPGPVEESTSRTLLQVPRSIIPLTVVIGGIPLAVRPKVDSSVALARSLLSQFHPKYTPQPEVDRR